jgi:hypothetical protein
VTHSDYTLAEKEQGDNSKWLATERVCVNETKDAVLSFESIEKRTSLVTNPIESDDFERLMNLKVEELTGEKYRKHKQILIQTRLH